MKFNVVPKPSLPNGVRLISQGAQLAYWDVAQEFEIHAQGVASPLLFSLTFTKDSENKETRLKVGPIVEGKLAASIVNPHLIEPTATKTRKQLAYLTQTKESISFSVVALNPSESAYVLFYYEFYEETTNELEGISSSEGGERS